MSADLIVIGGSAGSLQIVLEVLPQLSPDIQASFVIIFHRKPSPDSQPLIDLISAKSTLNVKEAEDKESIQAATIYIAPADYHLFIERDHSFSLDISEKVNFSRPSIDLTFFTAAEIYKDKLIGILLSGANSDGVRGLQSIRDYGGYTVAQNPDTSQVPYMPMQAIARKVVDFIASPDEIVNIINRYANSN